MKLQKGLKSKADKADVSRENEMLKSLFSSKNDQVHKELLSKADAKRITNQTDAAFSALARQVVEDVVRCENILSCAIMCILCYAFEVPYSRQYEKSIPKVLFD
jgi:hypothetical protein